VQGHTRFEILSGFKTNAHPQPIDCERRWNVSEPSASDGVVIDQPDAAIWQPSPSSGRCSAPRRSPW